MSSAGGFVTGHGGILCRDREACMTRETGTCVRLTPTSPALMLLLARVLAGAAKTVRQPGRKV